MTTDERHARYRAGLCITCGDEPHSAGRPRCGRCHAEYVGDRNEGKAM